MIPRPTPSPGRLPSKWQYKSTRKCSKKSVWTTKRTPSSTKNSVMKNLLRLSALAGFCLAFAPAAWAHHSQSEYDLRAKVEVAGTVTKIEWRSPHAWIYVDATNDKGETVNWSFELPSPVTLMRGGCELDSLKPGERVNVCGAR